jgi:hypothetical protein
MTQIEIGSKWKHKDSDDTYVAIKQYSHRVVLKHELSGIVVRVSVGHLNPDGFAEYERMKND